MKHRIIKKDVIVIGGGPGGYTAAFRSADLGKNVTLIEKDDDLGGVCLNRGCIPSKALLHVSKLLQEVDELKSSGITFGNRNIDSIKLNLWKNKVIKRLNLGLKSMAKSRKIDLIKGEARFVSNNKILVKKQEGDEIIFEFNQIIIATGSRSNTINNIESTNTLMTSKNALNLEAKIPETLLVVGGGYIGLEMGSIYSALGTKVTVVEFTDSLLPMADADMVKILQKKLEHHFENILLSSKVIEMKQTKDHVLVTIDNKNKKIEKKYSKILMATGRRPNTDMIGLENTDIIIDNHNFIQVDNNQQTSVENIYAIGDVTGEPMLAHKATHQGKVASESISGLPAAFDTNLIPAVIFTNPEIAWVGKTESELKQEKTAYKKGDFPWIANGKALSMGAIDGKTKILFDPQNDRILGVGIVGPNAGDLVSEMVLAMELGANAEDLALTIHPHPTLSETIPGSAEIFSGTITDLYLK